MLYAFFILNVTICTLNGQIVTIGYGPNYVLDKERVSIHPDAKGKGLGGNDFWFYQIKYHHFLRNNWIAFGGYSKYPIATLFHFYKENEGGSKGWSGTNVTRIDLGFKYNIFSKSKFIIQPSFSLGIQKSIPNGDGCICNDISGGIKPDNFELLKDIEADAFSNTQIVPVLGIKLGYAFWSRLELFIDVQQVFGFKTIQELRMSYIYKGVEQPQAISYSDGTGRFWALGIGYRFVKLKK